MLFGNGRAIRSRKCESNKIHTSRGRVVVWIDKRCGGMCQTKCQTKCQKCTHNTSTNGKKFPPIRTRTHPDVRSLRLRHHSLKTWRNVNSNTSLQQWLIERLFVLLILMNTKLQMNQGLCVFVIVALFNVTIVSFGAKFFIWGMTHGIMLHQNKSWLLLFFDYCYYYFLLFIIFNVIYNF